MVAVITRLQHRTYSPQPVVPEVLSLSEQSSDYLEQPVPVGLVILQVDTYDWKWIGDGCCRAHRPVFAVRTTSTEDRETRRPTSSRPSYAATP